MANKKPNWAAWALRFIGSLAYLAVVWELWQGAEAAGALYTASVFAPVLFGLAVVTSVSMFLGILAELAGPSDKMKAWSGKVSMLGGFALIALLAIVGGAVWSTWSWIALLGFVLAIVGSGMERM